MKPYNELTTDEHSRIAWYLLGIIAGLMELYLIRFRRHTLSEQMRYWIRNSKFGSVLVMFWTWVLYHFAIEPIIRYTKRFLL